MVVIVGLDASHKSPALSVCMCVCYACDPQPPPSRLQADSKPTLLPLNRPSLAESKGDESKGEADATQLISEAVPKCKSEVRRFAIFEGHEPPPLCG